MRGVVLGLTLATSAVAWTPALTRPTSTSVRRKSLATVPLRGTASSELGIPCEDECALPGYPNMPASVHPGVVTGQALMDLLQHARENGVCVCVCVSIRMLAHA